MIHEKGLSQRKSTFESPTSNSKEFYHIGQKNLNSCIAMLCLPCLNSMGQKINTNQLLVTRNFILLQGLTMWMIFIPTNPFSNDLAADSYLTIKLLVCPMG